MSEFKATRMAAWGGDFVYMCDPHLAQLMHIGKAMGAPVNYQDYDGEKLCQNCINAANKEAKKEKL